MIWRNHEITRHSIVVIIAERETKDDLRLGSPEVHTLHQAWETREV